ASNVTDVHPHFELVAEERRRPIVALGVREDDAGLRRTRPARQLFPERQPRLFHVGEVDRVIRVAHRIAIAEPDGQSVAVGVGHTQYNPAAVALPIAADSFTEAEKAALEPFFTNTDRPIFALTNLPETVKGALFARYSRSAKSVRRLFLDEFLGDLGASAVPAHAVGTERADRLYARVLSEYGDDSVAQLGG